MDQGREFFERISKSLADREKLALDMRFGITSQRLTLTKMGDIFGVTRERARQYTVYARQQIGDENWAKLEELYPAPLTKTSQHRMEVQKRRSLREYLSGLGKRDTLQYADIHGLLKISMPEERGSVAYIYDEVQSCKALMEDYGIKHFGRYHYCSRCEQVKPIEEFYRNKRRIYQFCRQCNTERCVQYFRDHADAIAARQRERVKRDPEKARKAVREYQERKKLGIRLRPRRVAVDV